MGAHGISQLAVWLPREVIWKSWNMPMKMAARGMKTDTCHVTAQEGHLEILKYTHEDVCPWSEKTWEAAAGLEDILQYLRDNDCPRPAES